MDENIRKPGMVTGGRGEWIFICSVSLLLINVSSQPSHLVIALPQKQMNKTKILKTSNRKPEFLPIYKQVIINKCE